MSLSRNPAPVQRNASPFLHDIPLLCKSHEKSLFGALPNGRAIGAGFEHLRTVANGCGRLRTVANTKTTTGEHSSTLRLPKLNENPSLRIRENKKKEPCDAFLPRRESPGRHPKFPFPLLFLHTWQAMHLQMHLLSKPHPNIANKEKQTPWCTCCPVC